MAKNKVNGKELDQVIESIKKKTKDPNAIMRLGDNKSFRYGNWNRWCTKR